MTDCLVNSNFIDIIEYANIKELLNMVRVCKLFSKWIQTHSIVHINYIYKIQQTNTELIDEIDDRNDGPLFQNVIREDGKKLKRIKRIIDNHHVISKVVKKINITYYNESEVSSII